MAVTHCKEHSKLARAVVDAGGRVLAFQRALDKATQTSINLIPYMAFLETLKTKERRAVAALVEHDERHGCFRIAANSVVSSDYGAFQKDIQQALVIYIQATLKAGLVVVQSASLVKNDGRTDHLTETERNVVRKAAESVRKSISHVEDTTTRTEMQNQLSELERLVADV
jgi:hypothetical protein